MVLVDDKKWGGKERDLLYEVHTYMIFVQRSCDQSDFAMLDSIENNALNLKTLISATLLLFCMVLPCNVVIGERCLITLPGKTED